MRRSLILSILGLLVSVSPANAGTGALVGTLVGASAGGAVGSQIGHGTGRDVAIGSGVVIGGIAGNEVGHEIDRSGYQDVGFYNNYGPPEFFSDPSPTISSSLGGALAPNYVAPYDYPNPPTPPTTYVDEDSGTYCRQYSQETRIGNQVTESYGTACLQPDGSWRMVQ